MNDARSSGRTKLIVIVALLTLVSVGATIGVSYLVAPSPRGFVANVATAFAVMVETAIGLLMVGSLLARRSGVGGAGTGILVGTVVVYAIGGFVTIGAYALLRDGDENANWLWAALLVETALIFVAAGAFWGTADAIANSEAPILQRRADHAATGRMVRDAASRLRGVTLSDDDQMVRADQLVKRLDALATALTHSHGGGIGSREGGMQQPVDPGAEQDLAAAAQALAADSARLTPGAEVAPTLERLHAEADRLRSAAARLGLA
jgi:hypothetical protein